MDRPLQNINDIDNTKDVKIDSNVVSEAKLLDNGWTCITTKVLDFMHDFLVVYHKNNIYSDDGYTLNANFAHMPAEHYYELRPFAKFYGCEIKDDGEIVMDSSKLSDSFDPLANFMLAINTIENYFEFIYNKRGGYPY